MKKTNIIFAIPKPHQRVGGIDLAIEGITNSIADASVVENRESHSDIAACDAMHFHGLWQPNHFRLYRHCWKNKIPYLISPHGMLEPWAFNSRRWKKLPYFMLLEKRHLLRANTVVATSDMERESILKLCPTANVVVIPLGLDAEVQPNYQASRQTLGLRDDEKVLLYLSRIDRKKSLDLLVKSLTDLPDKNVRLQIVGAGDETYENEIRQFISDNVNSLPSIDWIGAVWGDERWKYLQAADAMVLPTQSENFGFVVLESLWVGTPVLTTHNTPWRDYQSNSGVHLCQSNLDSVRDSVRELLVEIPTTIQKRQQTAVFCRKQFHWNQLQSAYKNAYQKVLNQG